MSSAAALKIHAPLLIATATIFIAVDIGMIGLRVWARRLKKLKLGADDYCCMVSCLLTVGTAITVIVETSRKTIGYESHIPLTSDVTNAEFAFLPYNHLANGSSWTRKDQLPPVLPARLRQNRESHLFHICTSMIICTAAWTIAFTFAWIFLCGTHVWIFWHSIARRKGNCVDTDPLTYGLAISDFLFDVIIISLPVTRIWRLELSPARKLQLTGIFLLGGVTIAASCIRLAVLDRKSVV